MRLFLIRHGQTPHNVTGAIDTAFPGAALTALGRSQARAVPNALAAEEIEAGELELRTDRAAVHVYAECLATWMRGDLERSMPGGALGHEFYGRYETAVRTIAKEHGPEDNVVVFSHGAAIRV